MKRIIILLLIMLIVTSCSNSGSINNVGKLIGYENHSDMYSVELRSYALEDRNRTYYWNAIVDEDEDKYELVDIISKASEKKQKDISISLSGHTYSYPSIILKLSDSSIVELIWDYPNNSLMLANQKYYINSQDDMDNLYSFFEKYLGDKINDPLR